MVVHDLGMSLSVQQHLLLAPMYYSILDLRHLESISTLDWDSDADAVHRRLSAVLSAMDSMITLIKFRIPDHAMEEIWVRIWAWMQFVDDFREQLSLTLLRLPSTAAFTSEPSDISPHQHLFSQILHSYLIEHKPAASNFLQSNPRIFAIVGRAWTAMLSQEATDQRRQDFESDAWQGIYAASFSLLYHGRELLRRDGPHMEQLLDGVGGTWGHLASLLTRHLQQSIPDPLGTPQSNDVERVYKALEFLRDAQKDGDPRLELRAALVNEGVVATLTGLSMRLVNTPYTDHPENIKTPGTNFHTLITLVLSDARSELRLVEALRAGLLRSLVEYARARQYMRGTMLDAARFLLATGIPRHCVYLSVLRALRVAFAEIEDPELNPAQHFVRVGLGQEWTECERLVRESLTVVDVYDTGTLSSMRACDNAECGVVGDKRQLKRCAGCRDAWFCSRECQKADWRHGHRKNCKTMRDAFIAYSSNLKPTDRAFHRALLNSHYAAHGEAITVQSIPYIVNSNGTPLMTEIDYRVGRMKFKISPVARYEFDGSLGVLVERAQRAGDRAQLTLMTYAQGSTVRVHGLLLRFAEPDLYVGLRAYAARFERRDEQSQIIIERRRIEELLPLAGLWTH
ncbi:hypothetical protein C8F01DRAFT_146986 [Mycena amicta]|nr:hypothetical protein C8F01DRAFT_146986 [Mycena amicta]